MFTKKQLQLIIPLAKRFLKALIAVIIAISAIWFLSGQISKAGNVILEKKKLSLILSKRNEITLKLTEDFQVVGSNDKKIADALPPADSILEFISTLDGIAQRNGFNQTLRFGTPVLFSSDAGKILLSTIDYSITMDGAAVTNFTKYLEEFERMPYFSGISNVIFNSPGGRGWDDNSTILMQAKLYTKWIQD